MRNTPSRSARQPAAASPPVPVHAPAAGGEGGALEWLQLDRQLCFALYSASLAMTRQYKPFLEPLGLTYPQYLVMLVLWQDGDGVTMSALGERLALDSGTLTPLLKRLEAAGLVERSRDAADERRVQVRPTPAALALQQRAAGLPMQMAAASGCSLDELRDLTARLQSLRDTLNLSAEGAAA